ncbi:XdhC family protein [Notoacmeibacter sp. MSK16QG-6]|uniref:XdhC family protein n=1 Tax=Notoacmeibacter sp. MSK16QG-6 TaxID=2957982 RepID=UPI00209E3624|nr:XdhC family protein [Notoacmeibacter sp. MSK16QG-6]MCP1199436.1 XdhC family protein [Notoacmeibacter sp. MSK16QG-6]
MKKSILEQLNEARASRRGAVTVASEEEGVRQLLLEGEMPDDALGQAASKVLRAGKAGTADVDGEALFLNAYVPPVRFVVIGAVHISQALAPMARAAGYDLEIIDPRGAFATPDRFPDVTLHADWPQDVLSSRPLDAYTALAAITHDPKIDDPALIAALEANCFYIGALGSRKTHGRRIERLTDAGFGQAAIGRIDAPIGLDIGAANPQEIAVAVLAQMIAAFRKRGMESLV